MRRRARPARCVLACARGATTGAVGRAPLDGARLRRDRHDRARTGGQDRRRGPRGRGRTAGASRSPALRGVRARRRHGVAATSSCRRPLVRCPTTPSSSTRPAAAVRRRGPAGGVRLLRHRDVPRVRGEPVDADARRRGSWRGAAPGDAGDERSRTCSSTSTARPAAAADERRERAVRGPAGCDAQPRLRRRGRVRAPGRSRRSTSAPPCAARAAPRSGSSTRPCRPGTSRPPGTRRARPSRRGSGCRLRLEATTPGRRRRARRRLGRAAALRTARRCPAARGRRRDRDLARHAARRSPVGLRLSASDVAADRRPPDRRLARRSATSARAFRAPTSHT